MVRTRVGYAGGSTPAPTYHHLGDHMETIQVDYDPDRIGYRRLLEVFWESHNPLRRPWSRQYASAVFYHDDEQRRLALADMERLERRHGRRPHTELMPLERFYLAEGYHQKYRLQGSTYFMAEFRRLYPQDTAAALLESTLAARLNGYLGGHGDPRLLARELAEMGLTPVAARRLWETVAMRHPGTSPACPLPLGEGG